jgi:hypothetical protein
MKNKNRNVVARAAHSQCGTATAYPIASARSTNKLRSMKAKCHLAWCDEDSCTSSPRQYPLTHDRARWILMCRGHRAENERGAIVGSWAAKKIPLTQLCTEGRWAALNRAVDEMHLRRESLHTQAT